MSMGLGYLFGDLMFVRGMCGISHGGGVDNVWDLMIDCGLRSQGLRGFKRHKLQGPDTFNKGIS